MATDLGCLSHECVFSATGGDRAKTNSKCQCWARLELNASEASGWVLHKATTQRAVERCVTRLRARVEELETRVDHEDLHFVLSHPEAVARQMTRYREHAEKAEARVAELERVVDAARDVASYFEDQHDDLCDQERTKVGECFCHVPELVAAVAALDAAEGEK